MSLGQGHPCDLTLTCPSKVMFTGSRGQTLTCPFGDIIQPVTHTHSLWCSKIFPGLRGATLSRQGAKSSLPLGAARARAPGCHAGVALCLSVCAAGRVGFHPAGARHGACLDPTPSLPSSTAKECGQEEPWAGCRRSCTWDLASWSMGPHVGTGGLHSVTSGLSLICGVCIVP